MLADVWGVKAPLRRVFHQQELADPLAGANHVFQISGGDPQSHLHDQRDRSGESVLAQDQQEPRGFSPSGIGAQAVLAGAEADCQKVDHAHPKLERGAQQMGGGIWRADAAAGLTHETGERQTFDRRGRELGLAARPLPALSR